jgi:hypothetical protein
MGMFDTVIINVDKLPISQEDKKSLGNDPGFQTKDFDCMLTNIYITDDGELKINRFDQGWDKDAVNGFGTKGAITHENERLETIPFHGFMNFYTTNDKQEWFEFAAKFTDGKLVDIIRIKDNDS